MDNPGVKCVQLIRNYSPDYSLKCTPISTNTITYSDCVSITLRSQKTYLNQMLRMARMKMESDTGSAVQGKYHDSFGTFGGNLSLFFPYFLVSVNTKTFFGF